MELKELHAAKRLALYASFKNEVITDDIFEYALAHKKEVFFPQIVRGKKRLIFLRVSGKKDLKQGSYEIHEPVHNLTGVADPSGFDIIIVPGVAFDIKGNRLGYGKGYYDAMLGSIKKNGLIIALAFDFQILGEVPAEAHDVKMDKIITEGRAINIEMRRG